MSNHKLVETPLEVEIHLEEAMVNPQRMFSEISHSFSIWEVWAAVEREFKKDRISS